MYGCEEIPNQEYTTVHVSPFGSDTSGDGSESNPYRTINYALLITECKDTHLFLSGGDYIMQSEIVFTERNRLIIEGDLTYSKPIILDFGIRGMYSFTSDITV